MTIQYPSGTERRRLAHPYADLEAPTAERVPGGRPPPAVPFAAGDVPAGLPSAPIDPRQVRPEDGVDFAAVGRATVAGVTPAGVWVPVATTTLPSGARGIIRDGALSVAGTITTATVVTYRLVIAGGVVPGWDQLTWAGRAASALDQSYLPDSTYIDVPQSAEIRIEARVDDAGTYDLYAAWHGWSWRG